MPARRKALKASEGIAPTVKVSEAPKPKPEGYVTGRPTDYDPSICDRLPEWGSQGKSIAWMAAELGQAKQTLYDWMKVHPEFLDAINRAMTLSQKWWEDAGQRGMEADKFNSAVWTKNMAARFRDEWTDTQNLNHGAQDSLTQLLTQIDGTAGRIPTTRT